MPAEHKYYLYAVAASAPRAELGKLERVRGAGGLSGELELVVAGQVTAITSTFEGEKVRPERRNLAAHQGVLRALMDAGVSFLPVAFGLVAPSRAELSALLSTNRAALLNDLARLAGKVEMGLRVTWDVENIFEFFVFRNPELADLRDRLVRKPGGATTDEKIELGRTFEALQNEARERHRDTILRALGKCVIEHVEEPPRDEKMAVKLYGLIARGDEKAYEQGVLRAAALFDDHYAFDYNGPWPPYNFVRTALRSPSSARAKEKEPAHVSGG